MTRLLFIIITTGLLTACDNSDLKNEINELRKQVEQTRDPTEQAKLRKQLLKKVRQSIQEEEKKQDALFEKLKETEAKETCETLLKQVKDSQQKIRKMIEDVAIGGAWSSRTLGHCTETGYNGRDLLEKQDKND